MRKEYLTPATQEQSITMCQLMAGSSKRMGINDDPISGSDYYEGIIFGE